jgi:serine/threonine protein kinase
MVGLGQVLLETYRLERLIAEGGMSAIYEARHVRVPKRFAIKVLRAGHAEALTRFRREAEIVASLDHPNIVRLVDHSVTSDGRPYMVLELLDGETLAARLARERRIGLDETVRIARQVAAGLARAHAHDVTHRDLKPENLFLTREGTLKVLDFGVAKLRKAPELTGVNMMVGTLAFMAPEQVTGAAVDPRTDQFALASIVYGMLAGEPAFEIDGPIATQATRILTHQPPDLPEVPDAVNRVLGRGLAKHPHERFATIDEFAEALQAAASGTAPGVVTFDSEARTDAEGQLPPLAAEITAVTTPPPLVAERTTVTEMPSDNDAPTDPTALAEESGSEELAAQRTIVAAPSTAESDAAAPQGQSPDAPPSSERPTMKPIEASPALKQLRARALASGTFEDDTVQKKLTHAGSRLAWIFVGAAAGGGVATLVYLLVGR